MAFAKPYFAEIHRETGPNTAKTGRFSLQALCREAHSLAGRQFSPSIKPSKKAANSA